VLHSRIFHPDVRIRLGIVEALGDIRDKRSIPDLTTLLMKDESNEVRFSAAIALGGIGDKTAIPPLVSGLRDADKYVRFSTSEALWKLGWNPTNSEEHVYFLVARKKWHEIPNIPDVPLDPLFLALQDTDANIRAAAVEVLGDLGNPLAKSACDIALKDKSSIVRWKAVIAFPKCNIPLMHLPRGLSRRTRERKNPYVASFLNFMFLGLGYNYLGKWWGFLLFQINLTLILLMSLTLGPQLPYIISYGVSGLSVIHTWYFVKKLPDL